MRLNLNGFFTRQATTSFVTSLELISLVCMIGFACLVLGFSLLQISNAFVKKEVRSSSPQSLRIRQINLMKMSTKRLPFSRYTHKQKIASDPFNSMFYKIDHTKREPIYGIKYIVNYIRERKYSKRTSIKLSIKMYKKKTIHNCSYRPLAILFFFVLVFALYGGRLCKLRHISLALGARSNFLWCSS